MLGSAEVIAFVPTRDPAVARAFYENTLGLEFVSEDPFALVFNAHGVILRIATVSKVSEFKPAHYTILGWHVASAEKAVRGLTEKGVKFERFPGMPQDRLGSGIRRVVPAWLGSRIRMATFCQSLKASRG